MLNLQEKQFTKTDHPISMDVPVERPKTECKIVRIMENIKFSHATPPEQKQIQLPNGDWEKIILVITGDQKGRQYDRLMHIWVGNIQIFAGCTPEPSQEGIEWKIEKDITIYKPALCGTQTFTMQLENYMDELHTGIPNMSFHLEFYPRNSEPNHEPWKLNIPDAIMPILTEPKPYLVEQDKQMDITLNFPKDIKELYLDLYVMHQNRDEFFWALKTAFREVEIYVDDIPAGLIWPDPILYTGGVNPLMYMPVTGLNSMNLSSFIINLTPFAGMLSGEHTISIRVKNNENYWLFGGSLFLYQTGGIPTNGKIIKNSLQFSNESYLTEQNVLHFKDDKITTEAANKHYIIQGEIETDEGTYVSTVSSRLQFSNDKSTIQTNNWNIVHGAQVVITDEKLMKANEIIKRSHKEKTYTLDCSSSYIGTEDKKGLSIHSNLSQTFTKLHNFEGNTLNMPYSSSLHQNSQAYAVMERYNQKRQAANANTTANIQFHDSKQKKYQKTIMTRGGVVYYEKEDTY